MKKKHLFIGILAAGMIASCTNDSSNDDTQNEEMESDTTEVVMNDHHDMDDEEQEFDPNQTSFGLVEVDTNNAISVSELIAEFDGKTELEATFKGEINEVCSKAGCWVNIKKDDGETFMVRFKDHFGIPTNTLAGTMVYLTGKAKLDTISIERQQHYLEDAEASQEDIDAITEEKVEMAFIADGVEIIK